MLEFDSEIEIICMADNKETCILGTLVLVPQWRLRKKKSKRNKKTEGISDIHFLFPGILTMVELVW